MLIRNVEADSDDGIRAMTALTEQQTQMLATLAQGLSTPPRTPILRTPAEYGMEFEEISFTTADGVGPVRDSV